MSLSSTVQTRLLPCNTFQDGYNAKCIFKITEALGPDQYTDTDWTLVDAGMFDEDIVPGDDAVTYPATSGVAATITEATLKAGAVTLEYVKNSITKGSIRALQSSNSNSEDINRATLLAGWGWSVNENGQMTIQNANKDYYAQANGTGIPNNQFSLTDRQTGGSTGGIPLKLLFECLRSLPFMPPTRDLELSVTFNTTPTDYYLAPDASGGVTGTFRPSPCRPQLILNTYTNPEILPGYRKDGQYSFQCLMTMVDQVIIPLAATAGQIYTTQTQLKAWNGKYLKDLMIVNQSLVSNANKYLPDRVTSTAQQGEAIQLFFNNTPVFPYPLDNEALKLSFFNDAFSDYPPLNIPQACYMFAVNSSGSDMIMDGTSQATFSNFSVAGVRLEGVVQDFQTSYTRVKGITLAQQAPINQLYFGRVVQVLNWNDLGEVSIQS